MRELALHIMDMVENSINAGATIVRIEINEHKEKNRLIIIVEDNGKGLEIDEINKVLDPFYTTRTSRRVGLGLSLFKETCVRCGGELLLTSSPGKGTRVEAILALDHIDCPPLGDMGTTLTVLMAGNPDIDFVYCHKVGSEEFELDTRELKKEIGQEALRDPRLLRLIAEKIRQSLDCIGAFSSHNIHGERN